jgi:type II secretion system protein N
VILARLKKLDWTVWKPRLLYGGFAVVAFALSLRWTFPGEAVKERIIMEAGARGWQVDMGDVGSGGLLGVRAEDVRLEDGTGLKIHLDALSARLELLPLLVGKQVLAFDARLFQGSIVGTADLSGDARALVATVDGIDLAQAPPLKAATGVDLAGKLGGTVDLVVPPGPPPASGRIDLAVASAGLAGGKLPLPGMTTGIPLQKVGLGTITIRVKLDGGKATAEKLEAKGGDAELSADGLGLQLAGQPRLEFAPLFGRAKIRLQPAFWSRSGMAQYKTLAEMAKGPDGAYALQVFGSLGHPRITVTPTAR